MWRQNSKRLLAYSLHIYGLVQGVFFRKSMREIAIKLGIVGFVCNCRGGSVEVFAEGKEEAINQFIEWCRIGPKGAKVENIDIHEQPLKNSQGFVILR